MKKFWQWMKDKKYSYESGYILNGKNSVGSVHPTKQMLIGYMIEYGLSSIKGSASIDEINEYYDSLVKAIEDIPEYLLDGGIYD